MGKTVSAGVVLFNEHGELLLCHATETHHWDIPKGMGEPGEALIDAALRELREETGIILPASRLIELGAFEYRRDKSLHLFALRASTQEIDITQCLCTSLFPSRRNGRMVPEMDAFAWVAPEVVGGMASGSLHRLFMRALPLRPLYGRLPAPTALIIGA